MKTTTTLIDVPQEVKDFLSMENSIHKNILYYDRYKDRTHETCSIIQDDEDNSIYFVNASHMIYRSKSSYYTRTYRKIGFTFDGKKVRIWFGQNIQVLPLGMLFKHLNYNWISSSLYPYITKGVLEKILRGDITNPIDLCKAYLKANRINCSPKLMYEACTKSNIDKNLFLIINSVAKDLNHWLEIKIRKEPPTFGRYGHDDLIQQARILDKKIDYKWSEKRMNEIHLEWTKEIMIVKRQNIPDTIIPNLEQIPQLPSNVKLFRTAKAVFEEGIIMSHCIYTNYMQEILNNRILVFHLTLGSEEATVALNWNKGKDSITGEEHNIFTLQQAHLSHNRNISIDMRIGISEIINYLNTSFHTQKQIAQLNKAY